MNNTVSKKALFAGMFGTALQWYDFAIFGYFAPVIATLFYPKASAAAALLRVFGVFAVAYVLAPLGSMFFGYIGDRYGRKRALSLSIIAMAIATTLIACLPTFETIGIFASIGMTCLRMAQGFVAGSEFAGSAIFLVEHAKPTQKAFYGSLTSAAYSMGVILAGLVASLVTAFFIPSVGFRLAFGFSLIAGVLIFYLRKQVPESPVYAAMDAHKKIKNPFLFALKTAPHAVIGVIGLSSLVGVITFGTYVFMVTYLHHYFHFSLRASSLMVTASLAVLAVLEPLMGLVADRIGHFKQLQFGFLALLVCSYPVFYCLSQGDVTWIMFGMIWMSVLVAIAFAPINAYMLGLFPVPCRYSGFSVSFHLGISLIGATTPLVLMWLIQHTGSKIAPAYYYMFAALIGFLGLFVCEFGRRRQSSDRAVLSGHAL